MSHLLESYSLQTGAKISKPFIIKNFFPTPEKYITIHNSSGMGAKNYDYFQEVVDEILPALSDLKIKILQIGTGEDAPLQGCIHLQGKTSYHQTAYIIENSMLHVGNDSFPIHLASASNIPIVALYSITTPEIAGPYFNSDKACCLVPDFNGKKPSFNPNESPKTVNSIKIENIVSNIYKALNIKNDKIIKTLFIGDQYKKEYLEFIPNGVLNSDKFQNVTIVMRIDLLNYAVNENIVFQNLNQRKFYIHVSESKKIDNYQLLQNFRNNIAEYIIDVSKEKISKKYVENLIQIGIKPIILYKGKDIEYLDEIKIELIDFNLRFLNPKIENNINEILNKIKSYKDVWIKTSSPIISDGKIFLTEEHLVKNSPAEETKQKIESNIDIENILLSKKDNIFIWTYN